MNLFKALSYKEWIKTRKVIGLLFLVIVSVLAYSFIEVTHAIRLDDANNVWYSFLFLDNSLPSVTLFVPVFAGLSLALVQFVPEMVNKRLKLTLHLPAEESSIIASMMAYGYLVLLGLFLFSIVVNTVGFSWIFSKEITWSLLARLVPAFIAGLSVYGFTAWICFEPQWKQRVLNLLVTICFLSVLYVTQIAGAYLHFGIGLLVILLASYAFPFYSVLRFKHGVL